MSDTRQCQALETSGQKCHRLAVRTVNYHGDNELYDYAGPEPAWVKVWLCDQHSEAPKPKKGTR